VNASPAGAWISLCDQPPRARQRLFDVAADARVASEANPSAVKR
jgi:hypothetical protein